MRQDEHTWMVQESEQEFLKNPACSDEDLKVFMRSPRLYFYLKNGGEAANLQRKRMSIGAAVYGKIHDESGVFEQEYAVIPKLDKRKPDQKELHERFLAQNDGKVLLNEEEDAVINNIANNLRFNPTFTRFTNSARASQSMYAVHESSGITLKARPDLLNEEENAAIYVRECFDASPSKFKVESEQMNHALTTAMLMSVWNVGTVIHAASEKNPPYQSGIYRLGNELVEQGLIQFRMALNLLAWSIEHDYWCDHVEFNVLKNLYVEDNLEHAETLLMQAASEGNMIMTIE